MLPPKLRVTAPEPDSDRNRSAILALWTRSVDAVTALDVDTARQIDEIVASLGERGA